MLPAQFELDVSRLDRSFNSPAGMVRPTQRRPEKYLLHFSGSTFSGEWEVVEHPRNGNFGFSVDTWRYQLRGQWNAAGEITGQSQFSLVSILHNKGQAPYEIATRHEVLAVGGRIEESGQLRLRFELTDAKWTFKSRPTRVPPLPPWEVVFDLPVSKSPPRVVYVPRIETDQQRYMVGERVLLTLAIDECVVESLPDGSQRNVPQRSLDRGEIELTFHFPNRTRLSGMRAAVGEKIPALAPIHYGPYGISGRAVLGPEYLRKYPEITEPLSEAVAHASFGCFVLSQELASSTEDRLERLVELFRQSIPSHRHEVEEEFYRRHPPQRIRMRAQDVDMLITPKPEDMRYGSYNNAYLRRKNAQGKEEGNDWVCGSCQGKTLAFLNYARFQHPESQLLIGIHYGPIVRGFPSLPDKLSHGEHHGVVVYKHGDAYNLANNRVFDPWPRQTPDVFPFWRFARCYADWDVFTPHSLVGAKPDYVVYQRGADSGFPTHGGVCYWNALWRVRPADPDNPPSVEDVSYRPPTIVGRVYCRCPVLLDVSDAQGRHVGFHQGKLVREIPGSDFSVSERQGDYSWYIALPEGQYTICATGTERGFFQLETVDAEGVSRVYTAAIDKDQSAKLAFGGEAESPLVLADGTQIQPRRVEPLPAPEGAGMAATDALPITAARVAELRQQADQLMHLTEELPDGWSKSPLEPARLLEVFRPLRVREGFVLRAYQFYEEGNGNGVVWALPETADFPAPADCPILENHLLKAPKPFDALDDVMEAIEGDSSPWSYFAASMLRRQFSELGALWHGTNWSVHCVLDEDPWKAGDLSENESPLDAPNSNRDDWTWHEEPPQDWRPQVRVEEDRVVVSFYTYCGLEQQRLIRHTDIYRPGKYRARVLERTIAEGPPVFVF